MTKPKTKALPIVQGPAFWEDGTPRSQNNSFTTSFGVPTGEWAKQLENEASMRKRSTGVRYRMLKSGIDNSTIKGLSKKADLGNDKRARRWMEEPK